MSQEIKTKGAYCSYCGSQFTEQNLWPRKCFRCWNVSYVNPIPVVVAIVPTYQIMEDGSIKDSYLVEQRNIEPKKGGWALPSGFVDAGESWQQAVVRELQEEVGLITLPGEFKLLDVITAPNGNMLMFAAHSGVAIEEILFAPNKEVSAIQFPTRPYDVELCFPTHNEMWTKHYNQSLVNLLPE